MNKILILLNVIFIIIMIFIDFKENSNPIPQFTKTELEIIKVQEEI